MVKIYILVIGPNTMFYLDRRAYVTCFKVMDVISSNISFHLHKLFTSFSDKMWNSVIGPNTDHHLHSKVVMTSIIVSAVISINTILNMHKIFTSVTGKLKNAMTGSNTILICIVGFLGLV